MFRFRYAFRSLRLPSYVWIALLFLLIYSSLSLVNHFNFRTFAHDLGIRNNAMFDYMQGRWNETTLMFPDKVFGNILGDHFCLLPVLVSPFQFLFGSYTLLIFQIMSMVWGGIGIFFLARNWFQSDKIAAWAQVHFYSLWGIFSALSFDYHDNVIAAMLVPWLFYHFSKKEYPAAWIYLALIWISKENMALWSIFLSMGLGFQFWRDASQRKMAAWFSVASVFVFLLIMKVLMPWAADGQAYQHNHYQVLDGGILHLIKDALANPDKYFALLFEAPAGGQYAHAAGIKSELHFFLLLSGGVFFFFKPAILWMALPILGQKLLNNDPVKWGVLYHYSIELVPLISLALFLSLKDFQFKKFFRPLFIGFLISSFYVTIHLLDSPTRSQYYHSSHIRFYYGPHWERQLDVRQVQKDLKQVPVDAVVSAHNVLANRLAFRDSIYLFPFYNEQTDYLVLLTRPIDTYPLKKEAYEEKLATLRASSDWEIDFESEDLIFFKRRN